MPELAEVEFMRRRWNVGTGDMVTQVEAHPRARIFRDCPAKTIQQALTGAVLESSERSGKQMVFRFGAAGWLGLHLGMTGSLHVLEPDYAPGRHDHLVLRQEKKRALVFRDPRMFGALTFSPGPDEPAWWRDRPPEILDRRFTQHVLDAFLQRRARSPIKAVLLMQERFPGIGNWMADEVLWRAGIDPRRPAGSLNAHERHALFKALRFVCRGALRTIVREKDGHWGDPPRGWLFHVRWEKGGRCPKTGQPLMHDTVGGRTTCWSPAVQK